MDVAAEQHDRHRRCVWTTGGGRWYPKLRPVIWRGGDCELTFSRAFCRAVTLCWVVSSKTFGGDALTELQFHHMDWTDRIKTMAEATKHSSVDLEQLLSRSQLPALPQSAISILDLSKDLDNGPADFAVPIESDPGLAGQVLRFVNSSYFGFSREISSVKLAITLVGVSTIRNFTLWSAVFSLMPNPKCGSFDLKNLWQDSLRRGLFARHMGTSLGLRDAEEPFVAALLQDMAVPLLAKEFPEQYEELLEARKDGAVQLSVLERERFGWSHGEAAAKMARHWNLPDTLADLVENHSQAEETLAVSDDATVRAVTLSSLLPASADPIWHDREIWEKWYNELSGEKSPSVKEILGKVDDEFEGFAALFAMSTPTKTLVDFYEEETAATE
jgi:HD-like signal output (HDOD) protein